MIPYVKQIPARLADVLTQMDGLPVFFVDAMPDQVIGQEEKWYGFQNPACKYRSQI